MNARRNTAIGFSVGAFVALVALHGEAFFSALGAIPQVIQKFSSALPLGSGSFFLALALSMGVWGLAIRYMHTPVDNEGFGKDFRSEFYSLATGVMTMLLMSLQQPVTELLQALLLGAVAGMFAPWIAKGAVALFNVAVFSRVEEAVDDSDGPEPQ